MMMASLGRASSSMVSLFKARKEFCIISVILQVDDLHLSHFAWTCSKIEWRRSWSWVWGRHVLQLPFDRVGFEKANPDGRASSPPYCEDDDRILSRTSILTPFISFQRREVGFFAEGEQSQAMSQKNRQTTFMVVFICALFLPLS